VLARALANQEKGPDIRLETRLQALDEKIMQYVGHEADSLRSEQQTLRNEQQIIRQEMELVRRLWQNTQPNAASTIPAAEPAWAPALIANLQAITECLKSAPMTPPQELAQPSAPSQPLELAQPVEPAQPFALDPTRDSTVWLTAEQVAQALSSTTDDLQPSDVFTADRAAPAVEKEEVVSPLASSSAGTAPITKNTVKTVTQAWAAPLVQSLQGIVERLQNPPSLPPTSPSSSVSEPAWTGPLVQSLQAVVERVQAPIPNDTAQEPPPWVASVVQSLQLVAERLQAPSVPPPMPSPAQEEPAWVQSVIASFAALVERVQQPPAAPTAPAAPVATTDSAEKSASMGDLGTVLSSVVEKGFAGLGALIRDAQGPSPARHSSLAFKPMDDTSMTLAPVIQVSAPSDAPHSEFVHDEHTPADVFEKVAVPAATSAASIAEQVPALHEDGTTKAFGHQSTRANKMAVHMTPELLESMRVMVSEEIEARMLRGEVGVRSDVNARSSAKAGHTSRQTHMTAANSMSTEQVRALIAAEWERRSGGAIERNADADLRSHFVRVLPSVLENEQVRQQLFAVLALEASEKPGVLAELTGLRNFLKRELQHAAEELAGRLQTS
jgi:hypothetical protein